jgi:hypothetical protein
VTTRPKTPQGTTPGAPAAVQVADRWHFLLNTRQTGELRLARVHPRLKQLPSAKIPPPLDPPDQSLPASPRRGARPRRGGRAVGEGLYDVRRRRAAWQSLRLINRETGLARATVRKYAFSERFPRHGRSGPGRSHLDPH